MCMTDRRASRARAAMRSGVRAVRPEHREVGACALRVLEDPQGLMGCALLHTAYLQQECWEKR